MSGGYCDPSEISQTIILGVIEVVIDVLPSNVLIGEPRVQHELAVSDSPHAAAAQTADGFDEATRASA